MIIDASIPSRRKITKVGTIRAFGLSGLSSVRLTELPQYCQ